MSASRLEAALAARDAVEVELALNDAYRDGIDIQYLPALIHLLDEKWHERHEDVARALQGLKAPGAELALERAAATRHDYPTIDDGLAFARKCTRALADIGSSAARGALERLAEGRDAQVAEYARKRLDAWSKEAPRKGAQD